MKKKFKQCFENVLNVSIDYLDVVLRLIIWDSNRGCFSSVLSLILGLDLVDGSF